jgi:hypothetical protein
MPTDGHYGYRNESPRRRAWEAHYRAKGCSTTKAYDVACRKIARSHTWPPAQPLRRRPVCAGYRASF